MKENGIVLIFNGEITNFIELKDELKNKVNFSTKSDTEVILKLYKLYGKNFIKKLKGFFSIIILDKKKNLIIVARDFLGSKPLYYLENENFLAFCSEIRPLIKMNLTKFEIRKDLINEYIVFGYIAGEDKLIKNVREFPISTIMEINLKNFKKTKRKYWDPVNKFENIDKEQYALEKFEDILERIIKQWSRTDTRLGVFQSGGIDSSIIAANLKRKFVSLNAVFPKDTELSEDKNIDYLKKKFNLNISKININESIDYKDLINLSKIADEPFHDANSHVFLKMCSFAKSKNIKTIITGDGGDEIFGGYQRYKSVAKRFDKLKNPEIIILALNYLSIQRLKKICRNFSLDLSERIKIFNSIKSKYSINKCLEMDQLTYLNPWLHRIDRISMANGIEVRSPFLDSEMINFANNLHPDLKIKNNIHKYLLRKYLNKITSSEFATSRKIALRSPDVRSFYSGNLKNIYKKILNKKSFISTIYDIEGVLELLKKHSFKNDNSNTLWRLLSFEAWYQSW
ncbi:MAG: asparagine synthase (glutamine-hydrolyzing) [Pelagibacteraceae bacterium TMED65]|nr:MAG: asparagine synthase (glutamine-hydrolyzing) [Pelagibacteraceae bacterium TMED65]